MWKDFDTKKITCVFDKHIACYTARWYPYTLLHFRKRDAKIVDYDYHKIEHITLPHKHKIERRGEVCYGITFELKKIYIYN